jgi:thiamine-monophosphate kinase
MIDKEHTPNSEASLIEIFKRVFEPDDLPTDLLIGIGDDAAAIEPGCDPENKFVITADMLVEDVHFKLATHSAYDIGWRTAVANLSDVAAMGATPRWGVTTMAVPKNISIEWITEFATGLRDAMAEHDAYNIGGDLTRSLDRVVVSMTLHGETTGRLLTRSGAQLGDYIAVTGYLGGSAAGLALLNHKDVEVPDELRREVIKMHLRPHPRVWAGTVLASNNGIHAMMDISDGLGIDLGRLCAASGTGFRMREDAFPVRDEVMEVARLLGRDPLEFVNGGEDFELLFTGELDAIEHVASVLAEDPTQPPITIIGEILDKPIGKHLLRTDGSIINPSELGWDHFKSDEGSTSGS